MLDAEGFWRKVLYILMIYIADMEEQWLIACLSHFNCPQCLARMKDLGKDVPCTHRTAEWVLDQIEQVKAERPNASVWEFTLGCRARGLSGVMEPFWKLLPFVDILRALAQDLLHSYHKFFFDHPLKWNTHLIGAKELDQRLVCQPQQVGARSFPKGISHISQMSGKEHRALERTHLAVVAGAEGVPMDVLKVTRSLMDYIYLAQYPSHDGQSLQELRDAISTFQRNKSAWIAAEARRSKDGDIIAHLDIPKVHNPHHLPDDIEGKGTTDNYTSETPEHYHIENLKNAYPFTNHREHQVRWLVRRERVYNFAAWQSWIDDTWPTWGDDEEDLENNAIGPEVVLGVKKKRKRTPRMEGNQIALNQTPDRIGMNLAAVQSLFDIPDLASDILRFLNARNSALGQPRLPSLPPEYQRLNVWFSIRIQAPRPNTYYKQEWWRIRAQPSIEERVHRWDPVLLVNNPDDSVNGLKGGSLARLLTPVPASTKHEYSGLQAAQLRLIFQAAPIKDRRAVAGSVRENPVSYPLLIHVDRFLAIPGAPETSTQLHIIKKSTSGRLREVRPLWSIVSRCPLAPVIRGPASPDINMDTSLDSFQSFHINKYNSHIEYALLR